MQDGGLEHTLKGKCLVWFAPTRPACELFQCADELVKRVTQGRQVAAAGPKNFLALGIVGYRVQQVFEG